MKTSEWRPARVVANEAGAEDMVSLIVEPNEKTPHDAGQHYELRLPGDELSRKYSVVSAPARYELLEFGIQVLPYGMVSPRLSRLRAGDSIEIRGPLGTAFLWHSGYGRSLILLGGGAGITPLLSIHEHFARSIPDGRCVFLMSAKSPDRIYRYESYRGFLNTRFTLSQPRLSKSDIGALLGDLLPDPQVCARICGPLGFIEAMIEHLLALGFEEERIRSEAFV